MAVGVATGEALGLGLIGTALGDELPEGVLVEHAAMKTAAKAKHAMRFTIRAGVYRLFPAGSAGQTHMAPSAGRSPRVTMGGVRRAPRDRAEREEESP